MDIIFHCDVCICHCETNLLLGSCMWWLRSGVSVPGLSGWCVMILRLFYSELVSIPHGGSDMIYLFVITISLRCWAISVNCYCHRQGATSWSLISYVVIFQKQKKRRLHVTGTKVRGVKDVRGWGNHCPSLLMMSLCHHGFSYSEWLLSMISPWDLGKEDEPMLLYLAIRMIGGMLSD